MVAPVLLIPLFVKATCALCGFGAGCYCVKKLHDAYKAGQKTKQKRTDLKSKVAEKLLEDNKKAQEQIDEWKKKYDEIDEKIKKREKEIDKIRNKLKDPNLTLEEKKKLQDQLAILVDQQEEDKKERDEIFDVIKDLENKIKKNNETVASTTSDSDDKRHWIWGFLTLENILIMGACYALYQILKDEKKK